MMLRRQNVTNQTGKPKRATIYFSPDIHKALRLRAAESGDSISRLVNSIIKAALADDAADFDAFLLHQDERVMTFEDYICEMRRRGRL
jgi:plasmid stability protein